MRSLKFIKTMYILLLFYYPLSSFKSSIEIYD